MNRFNHLLQATGAFIHMMDGLGHAEVYADVVLLMGTQRMVAPRAISDL